MSTESSSPLQSNLIASAHSSKPVPPPTRRHLLSDLEKWRTHLKDSLRLQIDEENKKKKQLDNIQRKKARDQRLSWKPSSEMVVSTFGKAPRDDVASVKMANDTKRKEDDGLDVDLDVAGLGAAPLPTGPAVSFPTAPRWMSGSSSGDTPVGPDPASYQPEPVRPHSARAFFTGRNCDIVVQKGQTFYATSHNDKMVAQQSSPVKSDDPPTTLHSSIDPRRGPTIPHTGRDGPGGLSGDAVLPGPGPMSYDTSKGLHLLSTQKNPSPSPTLAGPGRQLDVVIHGNSLFYGITKATDGPGVGKYHLSSFKAAIGSNGGVTIPKSGRSPVTVARPDSPKRADSPSRGSKGADVETGSRPVGDESHQRRSPSPRARQQQKFGKAEARMEFAIIKGQLIYHLKSKNMTDGPGVGKYNVKDGLSVEERLLSRHRPSSARRSTSPSRDMRNGPHASKSPGADPLDSKGPLHPSPPTPPVVAPGPGHYNGFIVSDFERKSFNRFLNGGNPTHTVDLPSHAGPGLDPSSSKTPRQGRPASSRPQSARRPAPTAKVDTN